MNKWTFPNTRRPSEAITEANRIITAAEALHELNAKLEDVRSKGMRPLVVFDLDATLFDNRPRILKILEDITTEHDGKMPDSVKQVIKSIEPVQMRYGVKDTLMDHGLEDKKWLDFFFQGWWERFFTNEYVVLDHPIAGAPEFIRKVNKAGGVVIYLTGRDTPGMRKGTLQSLEKHGFLMPDEKTLYLITKPAFEMDDREFKEDAIETLKKMGTVAAVFDNEPDLNNLMAKAFPDALHFFLNTMHSDHFSPLLPGIRVMNDFILAGSSA